LAAAISALDHKASVIVVEENGDIGGHGMVSGGNVHLGGGTSHQRRHGIDDSPDRIFEDWTRPDHREARYNDRDLVRAFAEENAPTFEWLLENGVRFEDRVTGPNAASRLGRRQETLPWPDASRTATGDTSRPGSGLVRALEAGARKKGAEILLRHKMTRIIRADVASDRVLGIATLHDGQTVNIQARKGVIVATGGHTSNVNFRRTFDPRRTEEYQVAGEPWSRQTGDGELAALAVGAALWSTANQTVEAGASITKTAHIGCRWGYSSLKWTPQSPIFDRVRASGLTVESWQNVILVNQAGRRFWNEEASGYEFFAAAMAFSGDPSKLNGGGPIWAVFDHDAVTREGWQPTPPSVDPDGYFFRADTLAELAGRIANPYQRRPMPAAALAETVTRYNRFVTMGKDDDFGKPGPQFMIQTPPFYAAWSTPILHDSLTGLRTNSSAQVLDLGGAGIPGLYCAGESQGGFAQHGLGRCLVFGRIAGREAALRGDRS
jgi:hypothetical protein